MKSLLPDMVEIANDDGSRRLPYSIDAFQAVPVRRIHRLSELWQIVNWLTVTLTALYGNLTETIVGRLIQ